MKIIKAFVQDPAREGLRTPTQLSIVVDKKPEASEPADYCTVDGGVYAIRKCTPFYRYKYYKLEDASTKPTSELLTDVDFPDIGLGRGWSSRAGALNVAVQPGNPLVDVLLYVAEKTKYPLTSYSLELDRAKRELRRHDKNWHLAPDAESALRGDLTWSPHETIPGCLWYGHFGARRPTDRVCDKTAYHPYAGRELGLCDECKINHDSLAQVARASHIRRVNKRYV